MVVKIENAGGQLALTEEQRMLVQIRDMLYEGSWDDFLSDLSARAEGRPHVFAIGGASPELKTTIQHHVELIEQLRGWEREHRQTLCS
jgi:hypothetical protein